MMVGLFVVILALLMVKVVTYEVVRLVPIVELRRRARADRHFHSLYQLASFGLSFELVMSLAIAAYSLGLVIWLYKTAWWLALLAVWLGVWLTRQPLPPWSWRLAALAAVPLVKLLDLIEPLIRPLAKVWPAAKPHSRIYEKADLLDLFEYQKTQADSRLSEAELKTARSALEFTDKKVADVMTPARQLKNVKADEAVGPHLMDELHASGQQRFAVVKELKKVSKDNIVGAFYLQDLLERPEGGQVSDVMHKKVYFINEAGDLRDGLAEFLKTKSHILMVINDFDEVVGALTTEMVFTQILGEPVANYDGDLSISAQSKPAVRSNSTVAQDHPEAFEGRLAKGKKDDSQNSEPAKLDPDK